MAISPAITRGWVKVTWDSGHTNGYRVGFDGKYDVIPAPYRR